METYCQSCGMPLTEEEAGTNKDGTLSTEYCKYCYKDGAFLGDMTVEQMSDVCCDIMIKENINPNVNRMEMLAFLKTLRRWK